MYMYVYINLSRRIKTHVRQTHEKTIHQTLAATKPQAQIFMTPDDFNLNLGTTST